MTGGQLAELVTHRQPLAHPHLRVHGFVRGAQAAIVLDAHHTATGDPTGVRDTALPGRPYEKAHPAGQVDPSMPG